jgi:hypothetical protein
MSSSFDQYLTNPRMSRIRNASGLAPALEPPRFSLELSRRYSSRLYAPPIGQIIQMMLEQVPEQLLLFICAST